MLSHENFINSSGDGEYPYTTVGVGTYFQPKDEDRNWAIIAGKSDPSKDSYVSIQSENKPGLWLNAAICIKMYFCNAGIAAESTSTRKRAIGEYVPYKIRMKIMFFL